MPLPLAERAPLFDRNAFSSKGFDTIQVTARLNLLPAADGARRSQILLSMFVLYSPGPEASYSNSLGSSSPDGPRSEQSTSRDIGVSATLISMTLAFAWRATVTRLAAG